MSTFFEWRQAPVAQFAVLGDPVGHSKSPLMQNAALRALGRTENYVAIRVPKSELEQALDHLRNLGYIGINATLPLKESLFDLTAQTDAISTRIGAVNTFDFETTFGRNTDAPGFAATLSGIPSDGVAVVLGAGGSARAIVAVLQDIGFQVKVWNRTPEKAYRLLERLGGGGEVLDSPQISGAKLVVNCTSGVEPAEFGLNWADSDPNCLAYDLMYGLDTPFLTSARENGRQTRDGTPMLVEQGAIAMEGWIGIDVPRSVMLEAVMGRHE